MKEKLDFYIFYKLDLQKETIKIKALEFTLNNKPIMGIDKNTKYQILDNSNTLTVENNETEIIFAIPIATDIEITDSITELEKIIKELSKKTLNQILQNYEIKQIERLHSTYPNEIVLKQIYLERKKANISDEEMEQIEDYIPESIELIYTKCTKKLRSKKILPSTIIEKIKKKVLNQDEAIIRVVTNAILNQRIINLENEDLLKTSKSTILLDGPTGVGKTLIVSLLAEETNLPIEIVSATNYSGVGYVGESLQSILVSLLRKANGNLEKAQRGIICFDEIDKLATTDLDIRKGIAEELLTWINGTKININYQKKTYVFDTSKLTFVCLGAFTNMREANKNQIGFDKEKPEDKKTYEIDDYINFGLPREFIGRFNTIISLNPLKIEDLENIIINSKISPLKNLITIIESLGTKVTVSDDLPHAIACLAYKEKTGARSISRIVNRIRDKILYPIMEGQIESIELTTDMLDEDYKFTIIKNHTKKITMSD